MGRLEGKRALITGAGAGIGAAAASLFAAEGARVAIAERVTERGQATAEAILGAGGEAIFIETDVAEPDSVQTAVEATAAAFGGLDILYNNAGGATAADGNVTEIEIAEFWRTISVDLFGTFLGCRFAIPHLIDAGGGAIVNTTSIRAMTATLGADAYTAAKGGVLTLTRALAMELAPHKIRVNAIAPGMVLTERVKALGAGGAGNTGLADKHLLGPGEPEDVANAALYLASDEAARVTGVILPVDSGASAV